MPTRDATAGSYHGTTTAGQAEVIQLGAAQGLQGFIEITKWDTTGDLFYALSPAGDDIDITVTGQPGLNRIADDVIGSRRITIGTVTASHVVLKSADAIRYSVERVGSGGGELTGAGGGASGEVELGATSLAALESVTVDTELPAAAALSDTASNPTTPTVGGATLYWDGSQWVRWQRNVKTLTVSAATLANVAGSASSVTLFASNANARGRTVYNDSTASLYVKFGATASTSSFTVKLDPDGYYEFPVPLYTGVVDGIWSAANGNARTTET